LGAIKYGYLNFVNIVLGHKCEEVASLFIPKIKWDINIMGKNLFANLF